LTNITLKKLDSSDSVIDFSCGNEEIDSFLKDTALSNQKSKFSKTYIFKTEPENKVIAYFSILASQLNTGDARVFGLDKIPVVLLGRLGVDRNYQENNIGKNLIKIALEKALEASNIIACRLLLIETSKEMKKYYIDKVNMGFEWYKDRKHLSLLYIDLLKHEFSR